MSGFDSRIPNIARMYDHYLGGKDNFKADRAAAEEIMQVRGRGCGREVVRGLCGAARQYSGTVLAAWQAVRRSRMLGGVGQVAVENQRGPGRRAAGSAEGPRRHGRS
jgi:hypothetical protein